MFLLCLSLCVLYVLMSFAYVMSCVCLGGGGMSEVYMPKNMSERMPPCGTPVGVGWM